MFLAHADEIEKNTDRNEKTSDFSLLFKISLFEREREHEHIVGGGVEKEEVGGGL